MTDDDHLGLVAEVQRLRTELQTVQQRQREGFAVDFNDFAYRPRERDWSNSRGAAALSSLFAQNKDKYLALLERFCGFDQHFRAISVAATDGKPCWDNSWLPGLDAVVLYGLVATQAPKLFMEIGSGNSTKFVRQSIIDHGLDTKIISIDPNPTAEIDDICDTVIRDQCENVPTSTFEALQDGDILFVDDSHRSFQNSDVTVFFTEILPSLAPGVIYGLHDMFLPLDYPQSWTNRFYNEQYLMMVYLLGGAAGDEVLFPTHHVFRDRAYDHLRNRLFLGTKNLDWLTSSFWMRRAK